MFQIGPREIGADLVFGVDLALFILQCGNRSGNLKSGEVFFSLNAISKQDANHYLCIIRAGFGLSDQYDDVQLIVEGIVNLRSVIINSIKSFHYRKGVS